MEEPSWELCAIPGQSDSPLTKGEFNKLVAQVRYYHLRPLKVSIEELKHMIVEQDRIMTAHIESDKEFFAQLKGAKWAIYGIFACLAVLIPTGYSLVKALLLSGVL